MEQFFKLKENNTTVRKEVMGGITTFLAMAYIIIVNPNMLANTGMPHGALVTATCLSAALATVFMGLYANLPFALASGMGLNAFFAFTICGGMGIPWQVALAAVLIEGIIFIILTLTKVREAVVNCIPKNLKLAVSAGIGLFIALIGLSGSGAGLIVADSVTLVTMGNFLAPTVLIATFGFIVIAVLDKKKVKGAILWGIVSSAIMAWIYALISPEAAAESKIFLPNGVFAYESIKPVFFKMQMPSNIWTLVGVIITLLFVDFFDTVGTLVGVSAKANMLDKDGNVKNASKALLVDAVGTSVGACLGTSTVTTFVESSAGVAEGARTGLASVITGILFVAAMFFAPILTAVPGCATAPALIYVGFYMMQSVRDIDFENVSEGFPAFLTIALMALTYSIGDGLAWGIMSYGIINFINNIINPSNKKKVSMVMYILTIVFVLKFIFI